MVLTSIMSAKLSEKETKHACLAVNYPRNRTRVVLPPMALLFPLLIVDVLGFGVTFAPFLAAATVIKEDGLENVRVCSRASEDHEGVRL